MKREELLELHYVTPIVNVPSILSQGLLSHRRVRKLKHVSVAKKDVIFARSWKHPDDQIAEWRHTSAMCAEVLVPDRVDPAFLMGAYVGDESDRLKLAQLALQLHTAVDSDLFFSMRR